MGLNLPMVVHLLSFEVVQSRRANTLDHKLKILDKVRIEAQQQTKIVLTFLNSIIIYPLT